jgi:hypothetical protein
MLEFICTKIKNEDPEIANNWKTVVDAFKTRSTDIDAIENKEKELRQMVTQAKGAMQKVESMDPDPDMF